MEETPQLHLPTNIEKDIEKYGRLVNFKKNDTVFSPEELLEHFFFVFRGRIKVSQIDIQSGKEQTLKILTAGDMYDVITLLDGELHDNLLISLDDDTQVMSFPIHIVRSWLHSNQAFNKLLLPYIAQQMRETEELAVDLSLYSTSERLLKLIAKNVDPKTPDKLRLIHDLPHEEIAAIIGTVRKVLNRHIQELKAKGIIDVERKNITLKNPDQLLENLKDS